MFEFIGKYFWALCIVITYVNFYVLPRRRAAVNDAAAIDSATLQSTRRRVFFAMLVPWVVMGIAQVVGGVPNVWSFFQPRELNPYVWSWCLTIFALSCAFAYWVVFADGAKIAATLNLVQVNVFGRQVPVAEKWLKVFAAMAPPFTIAWVWGVWMMDFRGLP
jgi:hypothetical protein